VSHVRSVECGVRSDFISPENMKDLEITRLKQARESLDEAQALLADGMDVGFVLTNLYYAYYYSILSLMNEGQVPTTMQSVTLGLFERQYVRTGIMKKEYDDAVHRVFDIKPKCSGEKTLVGAGEIRELTLLASDFIQAVETYLEKRSTP
jgi:uncharacterized protein (UPF0332 family)